MGLGDAMKKLIGIEDDYYDITEEEIEAEKERLKEDEKTAFQQSTPIAPPAPATGFSNVIKPSPYESVAPMIDRGAQQENKHYSMNGSGPFKMLVIEPKSFDECTKLVDNLKSRKPVIINLEKVETDLARKMFDFMSGATYALNGNVQRVTSNIFIFAPANVDIAAKLNRVEKTEAGYSEKSNPWR